MCGGAASSSSSPLRSSYPPLPPPNSGEGKRGTLPLLFYVACSAAHWLSRPGPFTTIPTALLFTVLCERTARAFGPGSVGLNVLREKTGALGWKTEYRLAPDPSRRSAPSAPEIWGCLLMAGFQTAI
jgi:hypothetical protein